METPVDPFPVGWFSVGQAAGLRAGEVRPLRQHGRHLVLWRDESGEAHLLDAYCVHLGAHLGYGGRVAGNTLRCPFHAWRYDGDGRCAEIPYSDRSLTNLPAVRSYPVEEHSGHQGPAHAGPGRWPDRTAAPLVGELQPGRPGPNRSGAS